MNLQLRFFATFREAAGSKTVEREIAEGSTVGEVLADLQAEYGIDLLEDGAVRPQVNVLLNGRDITHEDGIESVLEPDDTLSVFPPVAGGADEADRDDVGNRREKAFRGISERLAVEYLEGLGGEREGEHAVVGEGWRATLDAETVSIGPTMELTEVTVVFEGDPGRLDELVERFSQKAMRAGG